MLALSLLTWWYGHGWMDVVRNIYQMLQGVSRMFSVPILLRTLFAPWKRIISYPGASLEEKLRAALDNIVSRAIGFLVRIFVLLTAFAMEVVVVILGVISALLWPLLPAASVLLLVKVIAG